MQIMVPGDERSYEIVLEQGALQHVGDLLDLNRKVLIVTDDGVPEAYAEKVAGAAQTPVIVRLPQGEATKCMESWQLLLAKMLENNFTRKDCVVAVGGGVMGDLSGFAASCYMRGIDFYNIPTTVLSQVDSSIGGKTAVDMNGVKNCVGAFYPPMKVIIDPDTLNTLDPRQLAAGLAEAIKMAATCDAELFEDLEKAEDIRQILPEVIRRSLLIKKRVVEEDPKEKGLRKVLNFGHTLGHAVESREAGKLLHGECVAIGMIPMSENEPGKRIAALLKKCGLPAEYAWNKAELLPFLKHDKKSAGKEINVVTVSAIGSFEFRKMTPEAILDLVEEV